MLSMRELNVGDIVMRKYSKTKWLIISKRQHFYEKHITSSYTTICVFMNVDTHETYRVQNYIDEDLIHIVCRNV